MAVTADGHFTGTIGGGVMEADVQALAARALRDEHFKPQRRHLVHRAGHALASGLICAGEQSNVYLMLNTRDVVLARTCARGEGTLVIDDSGARHEEEPGKSGDPWPVCIPLFNSRRVAILGGGHCAAALSRTMSNLGYHVTVVEERADVPALERAGELMQTETLRDAAGRVAHPENTSVICMGPDLHADVRALVGALEGPFPFIGVMGAPAKLARIRTELRALGVSEEGWQRITAPVGLSIGSRTPEEIAVSVAGQLIQRDRTEP